MSKDSLLPVILLVGLLLAVRMPDENKSSVGTHTKTQNLYIPPEFRYKPVVPSTEDPKEIAVYLDAQVLNVEGSTITVKLSARNVTDKKQRGTVYFAADHSLVLMEEDVVINPGDTWGPIVSRFELPSGAYLIWLFGEFEGRILFSFYGESSSKPDYIKVSVE